MAKIGGAGGGGSVTGSGWVKIADVVGQPSSGVTVSPKGFDSSGTILQTATASGGDIRVTIRSSFPSGTLDGNAYTLSEAADGGHYAGTVDITFAGGVMTVQSTDTDGGLGATDDATITLSVPPVISAAIFTGGYPGAQTELKEGDTYQLQVTADKSFDQVVLTAGAGLATQAASIGVTPGAGPTTVTVTIADQGTTPQLLPARLQVRDTVTGALSATFDTDSAGTANGVNVVNLNDQYSIVDGVGKGGASGHAFGITYPGAQMALKGSEQADVVAVVTAFDSILYDDPTGTQLDVAPSTAATTYVTPRTVERVGGTYNVSTDNYRIVATRAANAAVTTVSGVVQIANAAAALTAAPATARVRSGPAPGNDTVVTLTADQELLTAPSMEAAAGFGTFQGSWAGGPSVWTRTLRVPDAENPADGSSHAWISVSATNLAGVITSSVTTGPTYVVGGFTVRTLSFPAFDPDSTETFPLTDEAKLTAGSFSNGNAAAVQPFGTADTTDSGKEGWCAPSAASGTAVQMHMLHVPTVSANSAGLTLPDVEETV